MSVRTGSDRPNATIVMQPGLHERVFPPATRGRLEAVLRLGSQAQQTDLTSADAQESLRRSEVLLTGWGCPRITASVLAGAAKLRAIVHAGGAAAGLLDAEALAVARDKGIALSNAGEANAVPVAEYCLAMVLLACKGIPASEQLYRQRRSGLDREEEFPRVGNYGQRVGIVTLSRISRRLIDLLRPFDLEVAVWSRSLTDDEAARLGVLRLPLDEVVATSDVVSVHTPLLPATVGLLDARLLASMKDGATLLNTARGEVVDTQALLAQLRTGRIRAILDVTHPEPLTPDHELWGLPNVTLTPHMAGSAGTELARLGDFVAAEVERLFAGRPMVAREEI